MLFQLGATVVYFAIVALGALCILAGLYVLWRMVRAVGRFAKEEWQEVCADVRQAHAASKDNPRMRATQYGIYGFVIIALAWLAVC
jgi:hypothetical protein